MKNVARYELHVAGHIVLNFKPLIFLFKSKVVKFSMTKKFIAFLFALMLTHTTYPSLAGELPPSLSEKLLNAHSTDHLSVIIRMKEQGNLKPLTFGITGRSKALRSRRVAEALKIKASHSQRNLIPFLKKEKARGSVSRYSPFWIFNGIALKATPKVIQKIVSRDDVDSVSEDFLIPPPELLPSTPVRAESPYTWNIKKVRAPEVWSMGVDGSGVVVGIFDTGVDYTHPDLIDKYRGGNNSWYDPHGEHEMPYDGAGEYSGHGTHVAGIILGGNASGKYIGVASGAQWIASRIWNDAGEEASSSEVHTIFQWFLDPDGDPETDDAPDVVNCSWGFKLLDTFPWCLLDFYDDIKAWREAGIIPVCSAGNSGPWFFTGESPANYPETISVGATDPSDSIAFFSSQGPSNCDLSIFPDISAPGMYIFSSFLAGNYEYGSGTSQAAPHVTGTIALMLSANPELSIDEIESTLKETATPLGFFHPNITYGWGLVDAFEAVSVAIP